MVKKRVSKTVLSLMITLPGAAVGTASAAALPITGQVTNALTQAVADTLGPTLTTFSITQGTVNVGDTITVTAKAKDDLSGVQSVTAYLLNGSAQKDITMTYDSATDTWSGTTTVAATDQNGTWVLQFGFYDNAGNYSWSDTTGTVTIDNPNADSTPPVINSVSYAPQTIQPGTAFTITADVSDNVGVDTVDAYLYTPSGYLQDIIPLTYDSATGKYSGQYTISPYAEAGNYVLEIDASDTSGNFAYDSSQNFDLVNPNGDTTAPVIGNVTVNKSTVAPGDTLTVSANISDTGTGLSDNMVTLWSPSGTSYSYLMSQDATTAGLWTSDISIPGTFEPGTWTIDITSYDLANNCNYLQNVQSITVQNTGDFTPPTVSNFQATTNNNDITFTATITDDQSTVSSAEVFLTSPSGQQAHSVALTYDNATGEWTGTYTIQQNDEPGQWTTSVIARDSAGNSGTTPQTGLTIANANYDGTAPVLDSFDITPANVGVNQDVTLSVTAHDDLSGVGQVQAYLVNPSGTAERYVSFTYDATSNKWVGTYTIANNDEPGAWAIAELDIIDKAGNYDYEAPTNTFTVTNTNTDFTAPVVDGATLSAATVTAGDSINVSVKAHDAQSSVLGVTADFIFPDGINSKQVPLTLDPTTNEWVGTLAVDPADPVGQWNLNLYVEDTAGNSDYISANTALTVNPAPILSASYGDANYYYDNSNWFNAVYFAAKAKADGDTRADAMLTDASQKLLDASKTASIQAAYDAYQLLSTTAGVPADIATAATNALQGIAAYYDAQWYFSKDSYYNAIYYAVDAISKGATQQEVQDLLVQAATTLESSTTVSVTDALNAYNLLKNVPNIPASIMDKATAQLAAIQKYGEAQWYYFDQKNNYNAVAVGGQAIADGLANTEAQDFLNTAAQGLLNDAATMSAVDAFNAYQLLIDTAAVPTTIQDTAKTNQAALHISAKYGEAQWYYGQGNFYNAVALADAAIQAGDTRPEIPTFIADAAQQLFNAAATMNATDAANAYQLLVDTTTVPATIQADAQAKLAN